MRGAHARTAGRHATEGPRSRFAARAPVGVSRRARGHRRGCRPGSWSASLIGEGARSPSATSTRPGPSRCGSSILRPVADPQALVHKRLREALALRRARLDLAQDERFSLGARRGRPAARPARGRLRRRRGRALRRRRQPRLLPRPARAARQRGRRGAPHPQGDRSGKARRPAGGDRGAGVRRPLHRRRGSRAEGRALPRPAREPANRRAAGPGQIAAQSLRLHRGILHPRRPRGRHAHRYRGHRRTGHRRRPPQFRTQRSRPRAGGLLRRGRLRLSRRGRRPRPDLGHRCLRPAQLRGVAAQPARGPAQLSAAAPSRRARDEPRGSPRRRLVLEPRLACRIPRLAQAAVSRLAGRRFVLESYAGAGPDHPTLPAFPEGDYLKFALGRVQ